MIAPELVKHLEATLTQVPQCSYPRVTSSCQIGAGRRLSFVCFVCQKAWHDLKERDSRCHHS